MCTHACITATGGRGLQEGKGSVGAGLKVVSPADQNSHEKIPGTDSRVRPKSVCVGVYCEGHPGDTEQGDERWEENRRGRSDLTGTPSSEGFFFAAHKVSDVHLNCFFRSTLLLLPPTWGGGATPDALLYNLSLC